MSLVALITLSIGAVFGLLMGVNQFRGEGTGLPMGIVHGLFIVSGIALFTMEMVVGRSQTGWPVLWLLLGTAADGIYLVSRQIRGLPGRTPEIRLHGGAALLPIGLLGMFVFGPDESRDHRTAPSMCPAGRG